MNVSSAIISSEDSKTILPKVSTEVFSVERDVIKEITSTTVCLTAETGLVKHTNNDGNTAKRFPHMCKLQ
jgi:hypothetical protein